MAHPRPTVVPAPRKLRPQIKAFLQQEVRPSIYGPLPQVLQRSKRGKAKKHELLTSGSISLGRIWGSSESSGRSERLFECEVTSPLIKDLPLYQPRLVGVLMYNPSMLKVHQVAICTPPSVTSSVKWAPWFFHKNAGQGEEQIQTPAL